MERSKWMEQKETLKALGGTEYARMKMWISYEKKEEKRKIYYSNV